MKKLNLRNLNAEYLKVNKGKKEIYFNEENNNAIVFDPIDKQCDTDSICNGIADDAYDYLINSLNQNKNLLVYWSQVDGTTSDYTIYHDIDSKLVPVGIGLKSTKEFLNANVKGERLRSNKYTEVINGVEKKIELDRSDALSIVDYKPKITGRMFIDHINGTITDNRAANLRGIQ